MTRWRLTVTLLLILGFAALGSVRGELIVQATEYTIDWGLTNPSMSPPSVGAGDLATFNVVVTQLSSDWPGTLTVRLDVKLDGNSFDGIWVYENQNVPTGITKTVSTKPWTATGGAHLVTWRLMFFGGDETVILRDPNPNNDEASLQVSVSTGPVTVVQTTTQTVIQTTTETVRSQTVIQTVTQSSNAGGLFLTENDLLTIGLIGAVLILILALVLRRSRRKSYPVAAAPPRPGRTTYGFCGKCGAQLEPAAKFCVKCGQRTGNSSSR